MLRSRLNPATDALALLIAVIAVTLASTAARCAWQAAAAIAEAEAARPIAEADRARTTLLAAVSHDLRTPLAAAKAAVSYLRSSELQLTAEDHNELLATVTANALRYSPAGSPPLMTASARGDRVEVRVTDHGPGVPEAGRDRMFAPFQRLGDTRTTTGVGTYRFLLAWPRRLPAAGLRPVLPGQYVGRVSAPDRDGQTRMRALPGADSVPALGTRRWTGFRHLGRHNRGRTARHAVRAGAALNGPIVTGSAARACMPGCAAISRKDRPGLADHSPRAARTRGRSQRSWPTRRPASFWPGGGRAWPLGRVLGSGVPGLRGCTRHVA